MNNGQHEYEIGYKEGLRQGKARERARLRRIWNAEGVMAMCYALSGGKREEKASKR